MSFGDCVKMAPKRMPKVTSLASSSSNDPSPASSSRQRNANPFGPVDPNIYHDFDEAMQDGVELEEKGERFQFGAKAQRFYVQAGSLYGRAAQLSATNAERRADALYNASRIHFLLATQFALPPENLASLVQSINTAQEAVKLAPSLPSAAESSQGALPNPFTLDTLTQLATAMQTLAEAVEELGWPPGLRPPTLCLQSSNEPPTSNLLWREALTLFQQVADGQSLILRDQATTKDNHTIETGDSVSESVTDAGTEDGGSEFAREGGGEDIYGYTSSLVTPSSLMETLVSMVSCSISLVESSSQIQDLQAYVTAAEQIVARAQVIASDSAITSAPSQDASQASQELVTSWEEIRRASLALRVAGIGKSIDLGADSAQVSAELENAMRIVNEWAARLIAPPTEAGIARREASANVAELCDIGEAGQNLCRLSLRLEPTQEGIAAVWSLATTSTKLFSQALSALDTSAAGGGSAAVLGQANTSTPTSRARCRILLALSNLSIFRSHPAFEAAGIPGAQGTRTKLIDNARLYARKAVTEIGLGWVLRPPPAQVPRSVVVAPPGGWESMSLESEATFHLLRALLIRASVIAAATDAKTASDMEVELGNLTQHISQLRQRPIQIGATPTSGSIELAHWLYTQGAKAFVDGIADDNGRNIVQDELVWWERLFSSQLPTVP